MCLEAQNDLSAYTAAFDHLRASAFSPRPVRPAPAGPGGLLTLNPLAFDRNGNLVVADAEPLPGGFNGVPILPPGPPRDHRYESPACAG